MEREINVKYTMELFMESCKRIVNSTGDIGEMKPEMNIHDKWIACQNIIGDYEFLTGIASDENSMVEFASTFSGMELEQFDDMIKDILGEFINWSNGSLVKNMGENNIMLDLLPQKVLNDNNLTHYESIYVVPFLFNQNTFKYVIALKNREGLSC